MNFDFYKGLPISCGVVLLKVESARIFNFPAPVGFVLFLSQPKFQCGDAAKCLIVRAHTSAFVVIT